MEDNGNEKDDEALGCDGNGHANENGVEQNTTFNQRDLHGLLLEDERVNGLLDIIVKV